MKTIKRKVFLLNSLSVFCHHFNSNGLRGVQPISFSFSASPFERKVSFFSRSLEILEWAFSTLSKWRRQRFRLYWFVLIWRWQRTKAPFDSFVRQRTRTFQSTMPEPTPRRWVKHCFYVRISMKTFSKKIFGRSTSNNEIIDVRRSRWKRKFTQWNTNWTTTISFIQ